jgi:hypothetical protein
MRHPRDTERRSHGRRVHVDRKGAVWGAFFGDEFAPFDWWRDDGGVVYVRAVCDMPGPGVPLAVLIKEWLPFFHGRLNDAVGCKFRFADRQGKPAAEVDGQVAHGHTRLVCARGFHRSTATVEVRRRRAARVDAWHARA